LKITFYSPDEAIAALNQASVKENPAPPAVNTQMANALAIPAATTEVKLSRNLLPSRSK